MIDANFKKWCDGLIDRLSMFDDDVQKVFRPLLETDDPITIDVAKRASEVLHVVRVRKMVGDEFKFKTAVALIVTVFIKCGVLEALFDGNEKNPRLRLTTFGQELSTLAGQPSFLRFDS